MGSFEDQVKALGLDLNHDQVEQFARYRKLIQAWNKKIDITNITDDQGIDQKHFLDSLTVFRLIPQDFKGKVVDVGTGGGFPGVPMKIMDPGIDLLLLDSLKKRINFLDQLVQELGLTGVETIHGRAEDLFQKDGYRESFDLVVSRAVAPLPTLLEYCLPSLNEDGSFIAMKGPKGKAELERSRHALEVLGGELIKVDQFRLGGEDIDRVLIHIRKTQSTPSKYPRGKAKPRKNPL